MRKLKNPRKPSVLIDLPYDIAPFSICKKKKKKKTKNLLHLNFWS